MVQISTSLQARKPYGGLKSPQSRSSLSPFVYSIIVSVLLFSATMLIIIYSLSHRENDTLPTNKNLQKESDRQSIPLPRHRTSAQSNLQVTSIHARQTSSPKTSPKKLLHDDFIYNSEGCLVDVPEIDRGPHIVAPPQGPVTLVCCNTTVGMISIAVHKAWAPIGAENFLNMVTSSFFSSRVPLFRALEGFLVQFGLAGDPKVQSNFEHTMGGNRGFLVDDPPWLPLGPPGREMNGVKRFQKGYMAYAGGGVNSRGTQLIMAFKDNLYLGGGSPWEVPFGQVVGERSLRNMGRIYTKYGEKVSQGKIRNRGEEYARKEFPKLDYFLSCHVTATDLPWRFVNGTQQ